MPSRASSTGPIVAVAAALLVASLALQFSWFPIATSDYTYFVKVWFDTLRAQPGLSAFASPFSDYPPLYLYFLKVLTFMPVRSLVSVKALSLAGNAVIAWIATLFARDLAPVHLRKGQLLLVFALFLCIPTLALNSSLWGQSDSLYAAPVLASLYFLLRDRPLLASVLFGIAISVKLQAIFFAPVLLGYLAQRKETWRYVLVIPLVFVVTILPAAFGGGDALYWLTIFAKESGEYPYLSVSAPSVFAFVNGVSLSPGAQNALFWIGMVLAALAAGVIFYVVWNVPRAANSAMVFLSLLCVLALPYLLPRMHERYFFLADIFSCLYLLFDPRRWYVPALIVCASLLSYMPFLSSQVPFLAFARVDLRVPSALLLIALVILIAQFISHFVEKFSFKVRLRFRYDGAERS